MPIRTLHLTNSWHDASGGIKTFYEALLAEANVQRRRMSVIAPGPAATVTDIGDYGRLYTVAGPRSPILDTRYRLILPHRFLAGASSDIWRIVEKEAPDLVEVCDKYVLCHVAGLIKRRADPRPTVVGFSQERMDDALRAHVSNHDATSSLAERYLAAIYMRQFDAHIANSEYTAAELRRTIDRVGPRRPKLWRLRDRIHVEPLGVDTAVFSAAVRSPTLRRDVLARAGGRESSVLIVFAGRLSPEKHVARLIPAVHAAVREGLDARLAIAGDGPSREEIRAQAAELLPGRVAMLGHQQDRAALATLLASADLFLHPNPREPFGIGPLEAMAAGTPVVLPRSGGVLAYATDRNAWLARPDAAGLGLALIAAIRRQADGRTRAEAARVTAARFSWPSAAVRYFALYETIHEARLSRARAAYSTIAPLIAS